MIDPNIYMQNNILKKKLLWKLKIMVTYIDCCFFSSRIPISINSNHPPITFSYVTISISIFFVTEVLGNLWNTLVVRIIKH